MSEERKEILDYFRKYATIRENTMISEIEDCITNLQEKLEVSQTNEETYRLEMLDITKCLGLDEDTIFDEVKEKATNLQEENEHLRTQLNTFENTVIEVNKECNMLFNHLTKKDLDYKSKNEKAIEKLGKQE